MAKAATEVDSLEVRLLALEAQVKQLMSETQATEEEESDEIPEVEVEIIRLNEKNPVPSYKTEGAACVDLYASLKPGEEVTIGPKEHGHIPTGIKVNIPYGFEMQIRSRSGWAFGDTKTEAFHGTIDHGFLDEIQVQLYNKGKKALVVKNGERIGQMKLAISPRIKWVDVDNFGDSYDRGGGFGSTGTK